MARRQKLVVGTISGAKVFSLDSTTRAEYDAQTTAAARAQVILAALTDPVLVKVYDGSDNVMGSGTMTSPWATRSSATLTVGEVTSFSVATSGTPGASWYLRFESGTRFVRGSFGLTGADFNWSLASWTAGQAGTIGAATLTAQGTSPPSSIGFTAESGYAVTGTLSDGASITITGTGFGAMGGDVIQFARGDEGVNGQAIHGTTPTAGATLTTFVVGLGSDTSGHHLRFSSANPRTGRSMSLRRYHDSVIDAAYRAGGFGYSGINKTQLFIRYFRSATYSGWVGAHNYKQYYVFANGTNAASITQTPQPILHVPAASVDNDLAMGANSGGADPNIWNSQGWTLTNTNDAGWDLWESWLVLNTPDVSDGIAKVWKDGVLGINDTTFKWQGSMQINATAFTDFRLGYMDQNMTAFVADYSDVYVADTQARVEIGNASTYAACTARELCLARQANWSDTSVQAALNVGAHGSLAGKYLYVVKSDGTAIKIGSFA